MRTSVSCHFIGAKPPLSPYAGSRASPEPIAAPRPEEPAPSPSLSSGVVDHVGELRLYVIHPPRFDSALGIVLARCAKVHGCFPWTSSRGPSSRRPSLAAPHHALASCSTRCARRCLIARVDNHAQLGHWVVIGEPPRVVPRYAL
jgi:hypothetical protein